jgi:ribosome-associated protein
MKNANLKTLNVIAQTIFDKKGFNILALDVRGLSTLTDYFVIAEGNIDRHVRAIGLALKDKLTEIDQKPNHIEGDRIGDWLVMDYSDFIIHLFTPEFREKYAIEQLWKEAKIVDLNIVVTKEEK